MGISRVVNTGCSLDETSRGDRVLSSHHGTRERVEITLCALDKKKSCIIIRYKQAFTSDKPQEREHVAVAVMEISTNISINISINISRKKEKRTFPFGKKEEEKNVPPNQRVVMGIYSTNC